MSVYIEFILDSWQFKSHDYALLATCHLTFTTYRWLRQWPSLQMWWKRYHT